MTSLRIITSRVIWATIGALILTAPQAGCSSTLKKQRESQLEVLTQATGKSKTTLEGFHTGELPPEHDLHLFLSYEVVNKGLQALDNYEFTLPNDQSITLTLRSVRISASGALPQISVIASAHKKALSADLELGVVLVPIEDNGTSAKLKMRVLSFVPKLSWWIFELTKIRFVETLLAAELDKITDRLPLITLPIKEKFTLGGPTSSYRQRISTGRSSILDLDITIPETLRERELVISKYVFLENGLHVFGRVQ